jgi:hypothetical protein
LWQLRYNHTIREEVIGSTPHEKVSKQTLLGPPADEFVQKPFGDLLVWAIEMARTEAGRRDILSFVAEIGVWQDGTTAVLQILDGRVWWYTGNAETVLPAHPVHVARARTMTMVPAVILAILADCVNDSALAAEAKKISEVEVKAIGEGKD